MRIGSKGAVALLTGATVLLAACSSTGASTAPSAAASAAAPSAAASAPASMAASEAPSAASGLPLTGTLKDGSTFTLNPRVADKLAKGEPINYVFSYGSTAIPLFSPQYAAGYERTLPEAQKILPMNGQAIAPASAVQDSNEQIAQIHALFKADQIDCLSIQSTSERRLHEDHQRHRWPQGIPVFTVGVDHQRQRVHELHPGPRQGGPAPRPGIVARLHEGERPRLQDLRRVRRRPDPVLGAGPHAGLPRRASRRPSRTRSSSTTRVRPRSATTYDPAEAPTTRTRRSSRATRTSRSSRTSTSAASTPPARSRTPARRARPSRSAGT